MVDRDEWRRTSRETWETMASGWERSREERETVAAPILEWLVQELDPKRGDTVLELAAGPGDTGFAAAPLLGSEGRLVSTDFTEGMVDVARRRSAELGLENTEHRVMDAERIDLPDDSVDGVLCRFGFMLMADPEAAFSETRRVLRPGGRLALAVWRGPEQNPWIAIAGRMIVDRGLAPPNEPGAPGIFTMADENRLGAMLRDAGFTIDRSDDIPVHFVVRDIDEYIERTSETGGAFGRAYASATPQEQDEIKSELTGAFAPFEKDGRYDLPGVALAVRAS